MANDKVRYFLQLPEESRCCGFWKRVDTFYVLTLININIFLLNHLFIDLSVNFLMFYSDQWAVMLT